MILSRSSFFLIKKKIITHLNIILKISFIYFKKEEKVSFNMPFL